MKLTKLNRFEFLTGFHHSFVLWYLCLICSFGSVRRRLIDSRSRPNRTRQVPANKKRAKSQVNTSCSCRSFGRFTCSFSVETIKRSANFSSSTSVKHWTLIKVWELWVWSYSGSPIRCIIETMLLSHLNRQSVFRFQFGRFIFALLAVYMTVTKCLNLVWILGVVIISVWFISLQFLTSSVVHLFVLGSFTALTFSPTFPLSFTFINQQIKTNPFVLGLFLCGGSIGGLVFQRTSGCLSLRYWTSTRFVLLLFKVRCSTTTLLTFRI